MKYKKIALFGILIIALINISCIKPKNKKAVSTGEKVSISKDILNNKFGFLTGPPGSLDGAKEFGGRWSRPHPGPFVWDSMQKTKNAKIDFLNSDSLVEDTQDKDMAMLATIWPFADWDQKSKPNADKYKVSDNDEFLPKGDDQGYLPYYRSNPGNWKAFEKWLTAVVERYDGDGKKDMEGLETPVKYWEVMNEPDLEGPPEEEGHERLDFYKEDASAYATLLIKTYKIIKKADPDAKVLIAGAAGGDEKFLDFYRDVFKNKEAISSFDIANVHCISNDTYGSFNIIPYKEMLNSFNIDRPIWITEAEAIISQDADINATQTFERTKKALKNGAQKIFFTRFEFKNFGKMPPPPPGKKIPQAKTVKGEDSTKAYQKITALE